MLQKVILSMFVIRFCSAMTEMIAAFCILRVNHIQKALLINSCLALIGPLVLLSTTTIGLVGLADKLSISKLVWVLIGVSCMFIGILKK